MSRSLEWHTLTVTRREKENFEDEMREGRIEGGKRGEEEKKIPFICDFWSVVSGWDFYFIFWHIGAVDPMNCE